MTEGNDAQKSHGDGNNATPPAVKSDEIKVFEYNPLLLLLVNGIEEDYRFMKLERIKDAGNGRTEIMLPPLTTGVTGEQRTDYRRVMIYLPIEEFRAKLRSGSLEVDFRENCRPPPPDPRIGGKMDDGTIYAGRLNGKDIYAAPHDAQGLIKGHVKLKFNKAAGYINWLNSENYLGHNDWRIPTFRELEVLCENQNRGALKGTFNRSTYGFDGRYWSSTSVRGNHNFRWSKRFGDGYNSYGRIKDRSHIRAVRG